jgi:23S rRNA pseudouridine2605 synthase
MTGEGEQHKSGERIAKVIARAGLASRREAEAWIEAGRVAVNGNAVSSPALDVTLSDRITIDGAPLPARERTRLFLYHKPRGLLTTRADPRGRPTIFQNLPPNLPRLISIGRLDFNTEGLLLLSNDGSLARVLELPATGWLRRYRVRAHGSVPQDRLDALRKGVTIGGIHYGAIEAAIERVQGSNLWLTFAIREGKNREVRNVMGHLGLTVTRLIRVSFGPFQLAELDLGAVEEVPTRVLREQLGDKLVALSEADFSAPIATPEVTATAAAMAATTPTTPLRRERAVPAPRPKPANEKSKGRKSSDHAWRAREVERPTKLLRRKFRGKLEDARGKTAKREPPSGDKRAGLLTDRKGRRMVIERYGRPPAKEPPPQEAPKRGRHGRRRASDRAFGARPRQPKGR